MFTSFIYILGAVFPIAAAFPHGAHDDVSFNLTHTFFARSELCDGVNMRSRINLDGAEVAPGDCTKAAMKPGGNNLNAFYVYKVKEDVITKDTDPRTAVITTYSRAKAVKGDIGIGAYGGTTCDHIMEINMLLSTLQQSKICDAAARLTTKTSYSFTPLGSTRPSTTPDITEGQKLLLEIREIIMRPKNLVSFQSRIETLKTQAVQRFSGDGTSVVAPDHPMDYLAMVNYVMHTTSIWSVETALLLDQAIAQRFPDVEITKSVSTRWAEFMAYLETQALIKKEQIENEKRKLACDSASTATGSGSTSTTPRRSVKRSGLAGDGIFSSGFDHDNLRGLHSRKLQPMVLATSGSNMSPWPASSLLLTRATRNRGAARSGPHAPGAPCCPLKKQKQKSQVKRSTTKTKPPPATKPRRPAHQPKSRPPSPSKRVVKRPANRPRRAVGKPAQRKRVTPKKKPRVVPKPARRPKGKPRSRRR